MCGYSFGIFGLELGICPDFVPVLPRMLDEVGIEDAQ